MSNIVSLYSPGSINNTTDQEIPIYTHRPHRTHGILPDTIVQKLQDYYQAKGNDLILEDLNKHKQLNAAFKHKWNDRHIHPVRGVLADGQVVKVYSSLGTEKLRAKLKRSGPQVSNDTAVNEAYDGAEATYNFLKNVFKIKSIDDHSFALISSVHFDRNYCNAYWDGDEMVYGDGDGKVFNRFTKSLDVSAHEQAHGLTQEQAGKKLNKKNRPTGIDYEGEAGGINEAYSDIIGIMVKQWKLKQSSSQADWLIGAELINNSKSPNVSYALRSMKNPGTGFVDHPQLGTDSQVSTYSEYVAKQEEDGEVDPHDSSGIVNKAFYTTALKLGGNSWDKAGQIFFKTLPVVKPNENFKGLAEKTIATAQEKYGKNSAEENALREGWKTVQVLL